MTSEPSQEFAELFEDGSWLRRFASTLVADHYVDDLVQSTWLAALQRHAVVQNPKRWLRAVAINLARMLHRQEGRSLARKATASAASNTSTPVDLVAQFEVRQAVGEALLALPEPTRTILVLRYQEGLEPAEIATQLSLQAAAVRQRLHRGRELVRARLHGRLGADWRSSSALLAFAVPSRATRPAAKPVSVASLIAVVCVAICSIAAIACLGPGAIRPVAAGTVAVENVSHGAQPDVSPPIPLERSLVASDYQDPVALREQGHVEVRGRLFDDRGQPLAGVTVGLSDDDQASAISDREGGFRLDGGRRYWTQLVVRSKGWARMTVDIPESGDVGDLTLARAQHLTGRVRDVDGNAIVGARVLAVDGTGGKSSWVETCGDLNSPAFRSHTVSDARGAFLVPDAVRGVASVSVSARGFETVRIPVAATTPVEVTLHGSGNVASTKVAKLRTCRVRAVDASTKDELTAFSAGEFWDGDVAPGVARRCGLSQVTATDGVVSLRYQGARGVEVRAVGYARQRVPMQRGDVVVELVPEASISGVVVDPATGAPLPAVEVRVCVGDIDEQRSGYVPIEAPVEALTDADGRFTIAGLGEGEWSLVATHAQRHRGTPTMVRLGAGQVRVGVRLESPEGASLTVELAGRLADPRCMLRLARITPNRINPSYDRFIDGAVAVRGDAVTFYGLDAGAFAVQMLVPQPTRFGRWRKVTVDTVRVVGDQAMRTKVDLAAGPHRVRGVLRGAGACPPMQRLLVVAERKIETNMTHESLYLYGPIARPADDGSFLLLAEPGEHTLLVVDIATRVILGRMRGVEVGSPAKAIDVGELAFRSRVLEIDLRGSAESVAKAEFLEIRAAQLWPSGLGKNQGMPGAEINSNVGVQLVAGLPVRPVWIPTCEVELTVRPMGGELVTVAASDEVGTSARLRVR